MINKHNYSVVNYKPLLHKKGKRWITVGLSALALLGLSASTAISNTVNVSANSRKPRTHKASHHKAHQHINIKRVNHLRNQHKARHAKFTHKGYRNNKKLVKVNPNHKINKRVNKKVNHKHVAHNQIVHKKVNHKRIVHKHINKRINHKAVHKTVNHNRKVAKKPVNLLSNSEANTDNHQDRTYIAMVNVPNANQDNPGQFNGDDSRTHVYLDGDHFVSDNGTKILATSYINGDSGHRSEKELEGKMESMVPKGYHISNNKDNKNIDVTEIGDGYNAWVVFDIKPNQPAQPSHNITPSHIDNDASSYPTFNWRPNASHKLPFNSVNSYSTPKVPYDLQNKTDIINFTDSTGSISFKKSVVSGHDGSEVNLDNLMPKNYKPMSNQDITYDGKAHTVKLVPSYIPRPSRVIGTYSNVNLIGDGQTGQVNGNNVENVTGQYNIDYVYGIKNLVLHKDFTQIGRNKEQGAQYINVGKGLFTGKVLRVFKVNGNLRYEIRYNGQTYFVTGNPNYTRDAYYHMSDFNQNKAGNIAHVLVKKDAGIYKNVNYSKDKLIGYVHKGQYLQITNVLNTHNNKTKLLLKNGNVVTANKNYMRIIP